MRRFPFAALLAAAVGGIGRTHESTFSRRRGYYNPGQEPQPRRPVSRFFGKRKKRRVPRAVRLQLMQQHGVQPSGRQWRKLRKTMRLTVTP